MKTNDAKNPMIFRNEVLKRESKNENVDIKSTIIEGVEMVGIPKKEYKKLISDTAILKLYKKKFGKL